MAEGGDTNGNLERNRESGDETDEIYEETDGSIDDVDGNFESKPEKKIKKKFKGKQTFQETNRITRGSPMDKIYDMSDNKMGKCLIFNHKNFKCGLSERTATDKDAKALHNFFEKHKFDVEQHDDKKAAEVLQILSNAQKENHKESSCFVCCVLTHGGFDETNKQEIVYAADTYYSTDKLFTPFLGDNCESLGGKPKLFFIQACRGKEADSGLLTFFKFLTMQTAYAESIFPEQPIEREPLISFKIPLHADFLIACSTAPRHMAFNRQEEGSWFIQSLCKTLWKESNDLDLLSILTIVCRKVAYGYESKSRYRVLHEKKQVPSIYSTLTRQVRFPTINNSDSKNVSEK